MPANVYHFRDTWSVPFPLEEVWEVISQACKYPEWWRGIFLAADPLDGDTTPRVGGRVRMVVKGWLPHKARYVSETTALQMPNLIEFKVTGDFEVDRARWVLKPQNGGTLLTLEWNPKVEKLLIKLFSPLLKPLFRSNHRYTMTRGQRQIVEYLRQRSTPKAP